jgi:hypothetical protein
MSKLEELLTPKLLEVALTTQWGAAEKTIESACKGPFLSIAFKIIQALVDKNELADYLAGSGMLPPRVEAILTMFEKQTLDHSAVANLVVYLWNATPPFYEEIYEWLSDVTLEAVIMTNIEIILARYQAIKHLIPNPAMIIHSDSAREQIVESMRIKDDQEAKSRQRGCEEVFMRSFGMAFDTLDADQSNDETKKQLDARLKLWEQSSLGAPLHFDFRSQSLFLQFCTALTYESSIEMRTLGFMLRSLKSQIFISETTNVLSFTAKEGLGMTKENWPHVVRQLKSKGESILAMAVKTVALFDETTTSISDVPRDFKYTGNPEALTEVVVYSYHICLSYAKYAEALKAIQNFYPIVFKEGLYGEIDLLLGDVAIVMKNFMNTFISMDRSLNKTRDRIREEGEAGNHTLPSAYLK